MTAGRHIEFDQTTNSVIRSADPENPRPTLERNMDQMTHCGDIAIRNSTYHEGFIRDPNFEEGEVVGAHQSYLRFPISHFLLVVLWNRVFISSRFRDIGL